MKYCLYIALLVLGMGCAKEEVDPNDYQIDSESEQLILYKNEGTLTTDVVNSVEMNRFIEKVDLTSVTYSASVPNKELLSPGKIILGNPSDMAPNGFMRRITSSVENGGKIVLTTSNVSFFEVFESLHIDAKYVTIGNSITRSGSIKKTDLGFLPLEIGADNVTFDLDPSFGMSGDFVFELEIDGATKSLKKYRAGIENLVIDLELISSFYGTIEGESAIEEVPIPLPFTINIPIGQWVLIINSRLVVKANAEIESSGGFELKTNLFNEPIDIIAEINPTLYPEAPHINYSYNNPIESATQLGFEYEFLDIQGSIEASVGLTLGFQMSPYNLFDEVGSAFVEVKFMNFRMSAETETVEEKLQATTKLDIFSTLAIGTDLLEKIWENANLWNKPPELMLETPELVFPLDETTYCFPCDVTFTNSSFDASCVGPNEDRVKMDFRVNSNNGSSEGFELVIDNESFGTFPYNQNNSRTIAGLRLKNYSNIVLKDSESTGCRLNFKLTNPCDLLVNCDGAPFEDERDEQEYCFLTMKDNKTWLASNLLYNDNGSVGVCHENMPDRCLEFGRYYTWTELMNGGAEGSQGICPTGYHVPTRDEWWNLLQAEKNGFGRVSHLIAPYFTNFGDYDPADTNGFNVVPAGQYQSWKFFDESGLKFSNSIYEDDEVMAFFWTSSPLPTDSKTLFVEDGAKAIAINQGGVYTEVRMPKSMGLPCRCIKNN